MKLFDWNELKYKKFKDKDIIKYTITLYDGYDSMPYKEYFNIIKENILYAIDNYCKENLPFYLEILINEENCDVDLEGLSKLVQNAFVQCIVKHAIAREKEYRLGAPSVTYKMTLPEIQIKWLTNFQTKTDIFGLELKHKRKRWRVI